MYRGRDEKGQGKMQVKFAKGVALGEEEERM
jgi:hypothetical protein